MKKPKTNPSHLYIDIAHQVKEYGLIARVDKVVDLP
jgi:predicted RNA-binding protein associated with RNAse of E/G family